MWFALEITAQDGIVLWIRLIVAWGRRRAAPNMPAPSLPAPQLKPAGAEAKEMVVPYPHFYVYNTPEEALAESKRRKQTLNFSVPPAPQSLREMV
jgi:hypothetical protein